MSRDEMSPAELAALERILAREHVGEEHLELAALVDSVRATAPRMDPAFRERLDGEFATRARARGARRLDPRRLAFAGGGLVAAAVAFTIVISSGLLDGAAPPALPAVHARDFGSTSAAKGTPVPAGAAERLAPSVAAPPAGRLVQRLSTLVLTTPGSSMQRVANEVVAHTEALGGVVANSYVTLQGARSEATFSLRVPSNRLATLVAALSSLASVRSLNQDTNDITSAYGQATGRLAEQRAERASLLKQIAAALTAADASALQRRLHALDARIATQIRTVERLRNQGHTAGLAVNVLAAAAVAHHKGAGGGPLARAFSTSLHALVEILAVALVVLAIILPFALTALAVWWSGAALRQRMRERAIRAA